MILITGSAIIRPKCRDRALEVGIAHSARSRGEPGCLGHDCHIDAENRDRLVFVEYWADMAALQAHFAVPASAMFLQEMTEMAQATPEMRIFQADEIRR